MVLTLLLFSGKMEQLGGDSMKIFWSVFGVLVESIIVATIALGVISFLIVLASQLI